MRATIISAVSNLSTAYNLVNVNLTNVAWLHELPLAMVNFTAAIWESAIVRCSPLWFRDVFCSCKQSLTLYKSLSSNIVSRAYIPVHSNLQKTLSVRPLRVLYAVRSALKRYCYSM